MDLGPNLETEEQLRRHQNDEFKALKECFADQIVDLRKLVKVSKNPKKRKREKLWIPIELSVRIESRPEPVAEFELHVKCSRKYPLVPPAIGFKGVRGIGKKLITKLYKQLKQEAANEEFKGQGCIALLIMRAQQFLEDHYRDLEMNNKSFYDQMVEQRQSCDREAKLHQTKQSELEKHERERQVEEIRQKILRKRELFNESKKRRDSQNSTVENDVDESVFDYDGDLDHADATTESLTDDNEASRLDDLDECSGEDEQTLVKSRRNLFTAAGKELKLSDDLSLDAKAGIQSRVDLEYEVLEELGHGGFGTVYKVRNKVDSRLYALKKVKLNPDNEALNERIMREVKLLSRLNHENVIRYYTAWNETEVYSEVDDEDDDHQSKTNSQSNTTKSPLSTTTTQFTHDESAFSSRTKNQESRIISQRSLSTSSDDETNDVYHTSYLINDKNVERIDVGETTANFVVFETSDNNDENEIVESMKKALRPKLSDGELSSDDEHKNDELDSVKVKIDRWLYIQMELGQGTLRGAIDLGLPKQKDRARRFFREILDGLCHIHRQGIIHRDLKPVNIFLDSMDRPKIGDFGLATTNLFIVTQNESSPGVHMATAIKPNRMSLEKLRLLASPEQGDLANNSGEVNKSAERLKYIHYNHYTDNIGTPLYMSPELSATSEKTRIAKVVYNHKVDVYSLGIIYFEMLYPFKTGHERIITLQDLRKKTINMPSDAELHLSLEDVELIRLLLTHDVAARPTTEKLLTSNLLPSVGLKEREYQKVIKQVVQNRQARTHKLMLRLLFEQTDSFVDDFVFDFEDTECLASSTSGGANSASCSKSSLQANSMTTMKTDSQSILKDFNTNLFVLDQVRMKIELLLRAKGFVKYVPSTLMPKYSASKYYSKQQLEDVVMLMDKNSSILTLPFDLRLPFARSIARTNINHINRYAFERVYRQRQILGYHPDQMWECCVDIVTPPPPNGSAFHLADSEILSLMGEIIRAFPVMSQLKPTIKINSIQLVKLLIQSMVSSSNQPAESLVDDILTCISESLNVSMKRSHQFVSSANCHLQPTSSLTSVVKDDLKRDLVASKLIPSITNVNVLINLLDLVASSPAELMTQLEHQFSKLSHKSSQLQSYIDEMKQILRSLEDTCSYASGLGLDLPIKFSAGFVLNALRPVSFYSAMVCMLECKRSNKPTRSKTQSKKTVILAVGGRYDRLLAKFSGDRCEVLDNCHPSDMMGADRGHLGDNRPKSAVGVSFEVQRFSRFILEDYLDKLAQNDPIVNPSIHQLTQLNHQQGVAGLCNSNHLSQSSNNGGNSSTLLPVCIRYWPMDVAVCSLTHPKPKAFISAMANFIRQLRDKNLMCNEVLPYEYSSFTLNSLMLICIENKIPYMMTVKCHSVEPTPSDLDTSQTACEPNSSGNTSLPLSHSPSSSPSVAPRASMAGTYTGLSCIATLYQLDKNRLREVKRCDMQNMLDYLVKKQ